MMAIGRHMEYAFRGLGDPGSIFANDGVLCYGTARGIHSWYRIGFPILY